MGSDEIRDAFGRTLAEQHQCALPILEGAFRYIVRKGWCPLASQEVARLGNTPAPAGLSLLQALCEANEDPTMMSLEYARRLVRKLEWDFNRWEDHPYRMAEEVLQLLRKAILLGGGRPPKMPPIRDDLLLLAKRRGGWAVSQ